MMDSRLHYKGETKLKGDCLSMITVNDFLIVRFP